MKNLSRFFVLGALAAGMASCSNDIAPDGGGSVNPGTIEGDGYLAVNIQLPTEPSTRALNDNFDDGLETEYAIKDAVILLFTGTGETDAVYQAAYKIDLGDRVVGTDQITSSYRKALKVKNIPIESGQSIYGLVMLNYDNVLDPSFSNTAKENTGDMEATTVKFKSKEGDKELVASMNKAETATATTFSTFQAYESKVENATTANPYIITEKDKKYFYMSNTVLSSVAGGKTAPTDAQLITLVKLGTSLYNTETEALNAAADIFVERGVAKVTLNTEGSFEMTDCTTGGNAFGTEDNSETETRADETKITGSVQGFKLGNLEYASYPVRKMSDTYLQYGSEIDGTDQTQKYRFVGTAKMGESSIQPYVDYFRTYWAEDPSYANGREFNASYTEYSAGTENAPLYCFENTFKVTNQDYNNSTRAVIKVQFNGGKDFFIINGNKEVFYSEENAKSYVTSYISRNKQLRDAIEEILKKQNQETASESGETTTTQVNYANYFEVKYGKKGEDGNYTETLTDDNTLEVAGIEPKNLGEGVTFNSDIIASLIAEVNKYEKLTKYVGGLAYYPIIIKHFGDDLTPWKLKDVNEAVSTTGQAYGEDDAASKNYLGRYGMVRNNWYDIKISKIIKLGDPVDPTTGTITNKPDDNHEVEKWIAFRVNVLKWAKRTHGYELQ